MTDIIVVGAGTAGLTAGIYACRSGKSVLIFEEMMPGGQIVNTPDIENYPGLPHISGYDYAEKLLDQATQLGAKLVNERVVSIDVVDGIKQVHTAKQAYQAKAVVLATGAKNRTLGLPREKELIGHGVSYCATCDGNFFRNKDVAVYGGGNTALEDALFLAGLCHKVYLIHRRDQFRGSALTADKLSNRDNVVFVLNSVVTDLEGENKLTGVKVRNKIDNTEETLAVSGLFVAIGQVPDNQRFANLADLDEKGYFMADESCKTKTPGVFVAGDCRTKSLRQLATAAADGAIAGSEAASFIA